MSKPAVRDYLKATALPDQTVLKEFAITPKGTNVKRIGWDISTADQTMSSLFQRLRESIKTTGKTGMFLYGLPSTNVIKLLLRIYNENILRNVANEAVEYRDIKIMIGVAEVDDGDIYITLSEDPREDPDYAKKVKLLYTLLANSNCQIEYPEHDEYIRNKDNRTALAITPSDLFPSTRIGFGYQISNTNRRIRQNIWDRVNDLLITETPDSYISELANPPFRVKFVHSIKYLLQRRSADSIRGSPRYNPESVMYTPFKRPQDLSSDGQPTGIYTCNNGSTCAESKMFSYLYDNLLGFRFNRISGYAAFWLGHRHPPNHVISGYNYAQNDTLFNEIKDAIKPTVDALIVSTDNKINNFIQLFALPCPGCFSNYRSYTNNVREKIDTSDCVHVGRLGQVARIKRRLLTTSSGGGGGGSRRKKRTIRSRRSTRATRRRSIIRHRARN